MRPGKSGYPTLLVRNVSHQFPQATSFSERVSASGVYLPTHCLCLPSKGVWGCSGVATPPKRSGFAHRWLRHPNGVASPTGGYAIQTEWLHPQVATPPKRSGFAYRWLCRPNGVASPRGGYATQTEWLHPQVAMPLKVGGEGTQH